METLSFQLTFSSSSSSFSSSVLRPRAELKIPPPNDTVKPFNPEDQFPSHKWSIPLERSSLPTSFKTAISAESKLSPLTDEVRTEYGGEIKKLRHLLIKTAAEDPLGSLKMVDAVQRLGLDHYFKEEIKDILPTHYDIATAHSSHTNRSLHEVALRFRILRQHGYFVSPDVFGSFMDKKSCLEKDLTEEVEGLTSLFEASQLCLPGEDKLEEIGNFCGQILNTCMRNLDGESANHVGNTLANPFHKSLAKLMVKNYFGFGDQFLFQPTNKWVYALQQIAKMDFNRTQSLYQQEMFQLSQWWRKTGLSKKLKFARDQPLKWYFVSMAILTDPCFSEERIDLTKPISFIYLIDDIYDLYGSIHELRLFTEAVRRWELTATKNLPDSMRICYHALYETTHEISNKIYKKHGWNPIDSLQKSWATLCEAFLVEAEWFAAGQMPSAEEYLKNGALSSGVHVVLVHIFFLLGQGIKEETVQLLINRNPGIVSNTATILRLHDDMGSAKDENQEGFDGSYIEYYMKENGVCFESTRQRVNNMISDAWKRLNEESVFPNPFPWTFIQASQNLARLVPLLYDYDETQNLPTLEKLMKSVLHETEQI